jgi:hypothetical protein
MVNCKTPEGVLKQILVVAKMLLFFGRLLLPFPTQSFGQLRAYLAIE